MSGENHTILRRKTDGGFSPEVALAYMETFAKRLDESEVLFSDNLRRIESRMDHLVGLIRDVAALQSQYQSQGDSITEIRASIRDQSDRMEAAMGRLHDRMTELTNTFSSTIDDETKKILEHIDANEVKHNKLDARFQKWLNRGIGGWVAMALVVAGLQYFGIRWLENLDAERSAINARIQEVQVRLLELEYRTQRGRRNGGDPWPPTNDSVPQLNAPNGVTPPMPAKPYN